MVWGHEVGGSNPLTPTINREDEEQSTWSLLRPKSGQIGKNARGLPGAGSQVKDVTGHQTSGTYGDLTKVPGKGASPRPPDGGAQPPHREILQGHPVALSMVRRESGVARCCPLANAVADQGVPRLCW